MRNFGLSRPEAVGGNQLPGSRTGADTTRANLILFPSGSLLESSDVSDPSIDERELGVSCFIIAFLAAIGAVLLLGYVGLQSLVL